MTVYSKSPLDLAGTEILGSPLVFRDHESLQAYYQVTDLFGVMAVYETGTSQPCMLYYPTLKLPKAVRDGFVKFQWETEDPEGLDVYLTDIHLDANDGELRVLGTNLPRNIESKKLASAIESDVDEHLKFFAWALPLINGYISAKLADAKGD